MMTKLNINDLEITCVIGCNPEERLKKQSLKLSVSLILSVIHARNTDLINDTVHYGNLAKFLTQKANRSEFFLIERLADVLARHALEFDPRIQEVEIILEKFNCIPNARSASIALTLKRP